MQPVLLRRTKSSTIDGEPVVKLPPREQQLVRKAFSMSEQKFYDQVQAESMQQLKVCASAADVHINDVHHLHHPHLCNAIRCMALEGSRCSLQADNYSTFAGKPLLVVPLYHVPVSTYAFSTLFANSRSKSHLRGVHATEMSEACYCCAC